MSLVIQTTDGKVEWQIADEELIRRLHNTPELQQQYAVAIVCEEHRKGTLKSNVIQSWTLVLPEIGVMQLPEPTSQPSTSGQRQPLAVLSMNQSTTAPPAAPQKRKIVENSTTSAPCGTENSDSTFTWTNPATQLLINLRLSRDEEFIRPSCKKINLWQSIAREMCAKGYMVTFKDVDDKFRNLFASYRRNVKKTKQTGGASITWPYFAEFHEVFGSKAKITVPTNLLGATLNPSTLHSNNILGTSIDNGSSEEEDADEPTLGEPQEKRKKGKGKNDSTKPMTSKIFYKEKLALEKQKAAEKKAREEERDRKREEYRQRKLQLLEQVVFNNNNNSISSPERL